MKIFRYLFLLLAVCPLYGQGAHRISQVIVKGNGLAANVAPYATIKVCVAGTQCATAQPVYSDSALTHSLPQPVVADASGNYNYYVVVGCYDEQISSPGQGLISIPNVCLNTGGDGNLTSFTTGNLPPLFTATLGVNPTTSPALAFTASNAAANSIFGNFTGSSATPTFSVTPTFSGANITALNASNINSGAVPIANLPLATNSTFGILKPDGTTLSITSGVASCSGCVQTTPSGNQSVSIPFSSNLSIYSIGNFSGPYSQPNPFLQGLTTANIRQLQGATGGSPNAGSVADVVTCGQLIPSGAVVGQSNCFAAFQVAEQTSNVGGTGPNPVAYYSHSSETVDGATIWGANFNMADNDFNTGAPHAGTTEFGVEADCNVTSTTTAGACILLAALQSAQGLLGAIHVQRAINYGGPKWNYGIQFDPGSVLGAAFEASAQEVSPSVNPTVGTTSSNSQYFQFDYRNSSGAQMPVTILVDSAGILHVGTSSTGIQLDTGDLVLPNGKIINTTPSTEVQLGSKAGTNLPHIDMYSSGHSTVDCRILGSGGTSTQYQGVIDMSNCGQVSVPALVANSLATTQTAAASSTASDHSIPIVVNGTTYYMRLSSTP